VIAQHLEREVALLDQLPVELWQLGRDGDERGAGGRDLGQRVL
jgi:hypothetical protein